MSRWRSAVAAGLAVALVAAPAAADTYPVEALRAGGEPLELPVASLDGAVETTASRVVLASDVLFAFGSARLTRGARSRVAAVAVELRAQRAARVRVVGHTDGVGTEAANLVLSRRRAEAVARALGGVVVETSGAGERRPVAEEVRGGRDDPAGRARNRRVELRFAG